MAKTKHTNKSEMLAAASLDLKSMTKQDNRAKKKNRHHKEMARTTFSEEMITGLIAHIKTL